MLIIFVCMCDYFFSVCARGGLIYEKITLFFNVVFFKKTIYDTQDIQHTPHSPQATSKRARFKSLLTSN